MPYKLIAVDDTTKIKSLVEPGLDSFALYPADVDIAAFRMVALSSGELVLANQSNINHAYAIAGITLTAATAGTNPPVQRSGLITNPAWDWTPGLPIFLGNNGLLTQDGAAITSGFQLPVGWVASATKVFLQIGEPILLDPTVPDSLPPKEKDPAETLNYRFDWEPWLEGGTITASSWEATGVTVTPQGFASKTTDFQASGGILGSVGWVTNTISKSNGEVAVRSAMLIIRER